MTLILKGGHRIKREKTHFRHYSVTLDLVVGVFLKCSKVIFSLENVM